MSEDESLLKGLKIDASLPPDHLCVIAAGVRGAVDATTLEPVGIIYEGRLYSHAQAIELGLLGLVKLEDPRKKVDRVEGEETPAHPLPATPAGAGTAEPDPPRRVERKRGPRGRSRR